ncbi:helix-turn-helix domain-containing protein [Streptomyces cyaneofuscatus]|uniref:helix-turn-helix domain-containing protein n=1 Tax=Streptomyces cyaneofuscatus TaxID=66883 RepID=UPI003F53E947
MSRWRELPAELDPAAYRSVVRLRLLRDHSGLSTPQLATKTGYSTKSWERHLGGRSLPPHDALEATARLTGEDPARLLALRKVAAAGRQRHRPFAPAPETPAPGTPFLLARLPHQHHPAPAPRGGGPLPPRRRTAGPLPGPLGDRGIRGERPHDTGENRPQLIPTL